MTSICVAIIAMISGVLSQLVASSGNRVAMGIRCKSQQGQAGQYKGNEKNF